jgi:hypothetical protein
MSSDYCKYYQSTPLALRFNLFHLHLASLVCFLRKRLHLRLLPSSHNLRKLLIDKT